MDDPQSTQEGPDTRASNITLPSELWQWIDQKYTDLMRSWPSTRKAAIIRAALMVAIEADPNVHGCTSDEEVIERFRQATLLPERTPRVPESQRKTQLIQAMVESIMHTNLDETISTEVLMHRLFGVLGQPETERAG